MTLPTPKLRRITGFRLTTADLDGLARFYAEGIGFSVGERWPIAASEMERLGLAGDGARLNLRLGDQRLDLEMFEHPGRPYPLSTSAADLNFQHFAIVVNDIGPSYERALAHGATAISTQGPTQLPASAGGVIAVKFRDPEGHPLEFLQFPRDAALTSADRSRQDAFAIDHSAISVADAAKSTRFYENLGLRVGEITLNHGETQAALDGLVSPVVEVVALKPNWGAPHLELLGYRNPRGRPAEPFSPADIAATRIVWGSDRDALLRDPDGHLHVLEREA